MRTGPGVLGERMAKRIYVLNGPNLNLLGVREPRLYGRETQADLEAMCRTACGEHGFELVFHQSNAEHELVGWLQEYTDANYRPEPKKRRRPQSFVAPGERR